MKIDKKFTAEIVKDSNSGWTCVVWPDSVAALGTGRSIKVTGTVDGHEIQATFLPAKGKHMLPLRAAIMKDLGKSIGDTVEVYINETLS